MRRAVAASLGLAILAGGCATGQFIRVVWSGFSTAQGPDCPRMDLVLTVDQGHVRGWATSEHAWGRTSWDATGQVTPDGQMTVVTSTPDPRVVPATLTWRGTAGVVHLLLTEDPGGPCPQPRTASLEQ